MNCFSSNDLPAAVPCRYYRTNDQCFTYLYNNVATRGCLSENAAIVDLCQNELLCAKCTGTGCNARSIQDESCVVCDSEVDGNCATSLNDTMRQVCPTSAGGMGCFRFDDGGKYFLILLNVRSSYRIWGTKYGNGSVT